MFHLYFSHYENVYIFNYHFLKCILCILCISSLKLKALSICARRQIKLRHIIIFLVFFKRLEFSFQLIPAIFSILSSNKKLSVYSQVGKRDMRFGKISNSSFLILIVL